MRRVPILFFLTSSVRGGVEEVVLSLIRGLEGPAWATHLAAPAALLRTFKPALDECGARTLELALWSWRQLHDIERFLRYLREHAIQIVNSHLFYATLFAAPLARLAGVPVVIETTHGPEAWRRSWWKRTNWVDRCVERFVTAHIAVSEANRQYLIHRKGYPARKIHVIPNGRDVSRFLAVPEHETTALRRRWNISCDERVLLFVGRLEPQKDPACLLDALSLVVPAFPKARLVMVGDGSLRPALERRAASAGLTDRVSFVGFLEDIAACYELAELVLLPSRYEGMPLVAIEAGAAARPIVATAVDGTCEVVEHEHTGLLVPPGDPAALARAICRLLADPERARTMGQAARRRVCEHFSLERQIALTAQVFQSCLNGAHAA
jgi:glycosyltransferase involved in cell wall biosynthesis